MRCGEAMLWHYRATSGRTAPGPNGPARAPSVIQVQRHSVRDSLASNGSEVPRPTVVPTVPHTSAVRTVGDSTSPSLRRLSISPQIPMTTIVSLPHGKPGKIHLLRQQLRSSNPGGEPLKSPG